jgi:hypothetical protein
MDLEAVPSGWRYAATYLEETIRQDGGWAAESSFLTIGPDLAPADYLSRKVTTALCAMALFRAGNIARQSGKGRSLPVVRSAAVVV